MKTTRGLVASAAVVAVTGGVLISGAGAATAANDPGFRKVTAPKTVTAGEVFRIRCRLDRNNNWRGAEASLVQKGATINAKRSVYANGNCTMRVILRATGTQRIRVVVSQNLGAIQSRWLRINVQPS